MEDREVIEDGKSVSFTFPDGSEYKGLVRRVSDGTYALAVNDLPENAKSTIDRLEARVEQSDDTYLFLNAHFRGTSFRGWSTGDSSAALFSPTTTFYSDYPGNPFSGNITVLGAKVDNLDLWLNRSMFSFSKPAEVPGITLTYSLRDLIGSYEFRGFELSFYLILENMRSSPFTREIDLKQTAHIGLRVTEGREDVSYLELVKVLRSVERLLGLAFRSSIRTVEIEVAAKDFDLGIGGDAPSIFPPFRIALSDVRPSAPRASFSDELAFTLDQIGDFQALLDKWSQLEERITPVVDLFLSSVSGGSSVIENILLNRIQGIEGFHRALRGGQRIEPEEYSVQKDRIIDQFTGKDRSLLKRALKFGNELSLAERLRQLDAELREKALPSIAVCDMDVVGHTRDYYSHYEEDITDICPEEELPQLAHEAGQMLFALILIELGIDSNVVQGVIARPGLINPF